VASHLRWIFDRLASGSALRINCGGTRCRARDGRSFDEDRFFRGGDARYLPGLESLRDAGDLEDAALYQNTRELSADAAVLAAYRLPLPMGSYGVSLHFIEGEHSVMGKRSFEARVETERRDVELLERYLGVPRVETLRVTVNDGFLDIGFTPHVGAPCIAAIEIESETRP